MATKANLGLRDAALLVMVALIWGCNFIVIKWGLATMPPLLFSALRFIACALPWVFLVPRPQASGLDIIKLGFVLGVCLFGFLFVGINAGVPPGLASLIMQSQVFFTAVLAFAVDGDRPAPHKRWAIAIGLAGIAIVATQRVAMGGVGGFALVLCGALSWGAANVMLKRLPSINMLALMVWISLVPPLPLLALSAVQSSPAALWGAVIHIGWQGWTAVAYTALLSTIVGYGLWGTMLQRHDSATVAQFALLVPVFGLASASLVYGESSNRWEMVAIALILFSLALSSYGHLVDAKAWRTLWERSARVRFARPSGTRWP